MFASYKKKIFDKNPKRLIGFSFLITILIGTILLKLPFSTKTKNDLSIFECFFTATSTTCITGICRFDIYSKWSIFGQIIILILTQLGALGIVTFYSIFIISLNKKVNFKNMKMAGEEISSIDFANFKLVFKRILKITLFTELIGGIILSFVFWNNFKLYGIFMAFFTSISAYCNAGVDLNGIFQPYCGFSPFKKNVIVLLVVSILTIIGGLGFIILNEICELKKHHKKFKFISIHSKVSLTTTVILIILGTITFFILEFDNSLNNLNLFDSIMNSFFHSISARSTGFSTLNLNKMHNLTKIVLCVLMLIGACPGGTGGGLKITTIAIIFSTTKSAIKNSKTVSIFKHKIKPEVVYRAISIVFLSLILVVGCTIIIYKVEKQIKLIEIVFMVVSCLSTTGFQSISINDYGYFSKIIFIILMFIGRIGAVNFATIFLKNTKLNQQITLPECSIQVD